VVTAGDPARRGDWNLARRAPERASRAGYYENVAEAEHATLLGLTHADAVVRAVDHVLRALRDSAPEPK
jgi:hypothetical protein